IARHHILKRLWRSRIEATLDEEDADVDSADHAAAFDAISRTEIVDCVRAAIHRLPPLYREVIVLCELQELDYATAAAVIEVPVGTVRSRLHRAKALLAAKLAALHRRET